MGGLGQEMNRRARTAALILCAALILGVGIGALAGGLSFGSLVTTVDLSRSFAKVPVAANAAYDALDDALINAGIPPADRDAIRQGFEEGLADVEDTLDHFPSVVPMPHLGGSFEIGLPLLLVDGVRVSAGVLSDRLIRGVADLAGSPIPSPIVEVTFDEFEGAFEGSLEADVSFCSWAATTELTKRFDAWVAAVELSGGVLLAGGEVVPEITFEVPPEMDEGVQGILAALHLDGIRWSAFALVASVGFEIGPPFLRIGATVGAILPITSSTGWWEVQLGGIGGSVGMVIRF